MKTRLTAAVKSEEILRHFGIDFTNFSPDEKASRACEALRSIKPENFIYVTQTIMSARCRHGRVPEHRSPETAAREIIIDLFEVAAGKISATGRPYTPNSLEHMNLPSLYLM